ncbi:MAG: hypothetical protein IJX70_05665 [Clostridia bacterium]|nr:hypothetical protein [Clostridia bacterium]
MLNYLLYSFNVLDSVYRRGAYCSVELNEILPSLPPRDRKLVTRLVHGVLEHEQEWNYILGKLCKKQPKAVCRVLLKLGMYCIKYMRVLPDYACVNELVELTKGVKREMVGFVNATLKAYIPVQNDLPTQGIEGVSIRSNMPIWLINRYYDQYGIEEGLRIVQERYNHTHVRWNERTYSRIKLRNYLIDNGISAEDTPHGYLVHSTEPLSELLAEGKITVQALDSIYICRALMGAKGLGKGRILDICAAPGGKSVYLAEHNPEAEVVAADLHPHRVALLKDYASRMHTPNVSAEVWDSTELREEWLNAFDAVLVDAPCSGLGVIGSNPDILLNRTEMALDTLPEQQYRLLCNAAKYVVNGGVLVYSTCTNMREENSNVVMRFLLAHPEFALEGMEELPENGGMYQFQSDKMGNDGFFVARMRRTV